MTVKQNDSLSRHSLDKGSKTQHHFCSKSGAGFLPHLIRVKVVLRVQGKPKKR